LQDVSVADAVYASCALPGFFPPGRVGDRTCVDGGVVDNLPAQIAALHADLVIAVDVGSAEFSASHDSASIGFAAIYMRAATIMMRALQEFPLSHWSGPPMLFMRPKLHQDWLSFEGTADTIEAGYVSATRALAGWERYLQFDTGTFPRKALDITVDRDKCIGCGLCASLAPRLMGLDRKGKAFARTHRVEWSRADGDFIAQCPTGAISIAPADAAQKRPSGGHVGPASTHGVPEDAPNLPPSPEAPPVPESLGA
jgi:NTE family protein